MREQEFHAYLRTLKSTKADKPLSYRVMKNILSRCASAERQIGIDLDAIHLPPSLLERTKTGGHEDLIPPQIIGDYRSAVRKYLDFRVSERGGQPRPL